MRRKKVKFDENEANSYVIQHGKELFESIKDAWNDSYFEVAHPITLEVGCGRGEYTIGLAEMYPYRNFIGMDFQGERIWYGAGYARENKMKNVAFLRARAEMLDQLFGENEIDEIWITFPGPRPKNTEAHRRLTHQKFLDLYKFLMKPGGFVNLKSDSELVYTFTLEELAKRDDIEILEQNDDIYSGEVNTELEIKTHYEQRYLAENKKITYIKWRYL